MKTKIKPFEGFSQETCDFYAELENNNNKDWFHANKKRYEKFVRGPGKSLIAEMQTRFPARGLPYIADMKKSLFRPNRDIRFSKNKDPYKTHFGIFFPFSLDNLGPKPINVLGLYFHIEKDGAFAAGGIHTPPSDLLKAIRRGIGDNHIEYEKIINDENFRSEFPEFMQTERLKRMPVGYKKDHPAADYLRQKQFIATCPVDLEITFSSELADTLEQKSVALLPYLEFFQNAIDRGI
ncbi:MAG: DUF2461 domain-containing protein [Candidatus Kapaibacterium sp.]